MTIFSRSTDKVMHKSQAKMQPYAFALAEHNGMKLDYLVGAIEKIDQLVTKIMPEIRALKLKPESVLADDGVKGIAESLGCYIAEYTERTHGKGEWSEVTSTEGFARYSLQLKNGVTFEPIELVKKKILNPEGFSISKNYAHLFSLER